MTLVGETCRRGRRRNRLSGAEQTSRIVQSVKPPKIFRWKALKPFEAPGEAFATHPCSMCCLTNALPWLDMKQIATVTGSWRRIDVDTADRHRIGQRAVGRARRDRQAIARGDLHELVTDDKSPRPGHDQDDLILLMKMNRQRDMQAADQAHFYDIARWRAPVLPSVRHTTSPAVRGSATSSLT